MLYLSQEMIMNMELTIKEMMPIVESVLQDHNEGQLEIPPKPGIHTAPYAFIHAMPGYIPRTKTAGIKWVSGYPDNKAYDLPQIMGIMALNDVTTGEPLAIMDCRWITGIRTSIVSAVTAKHCARKNSEVLAIIGAGVQGQFHALAMAEVLPQLTTIKVFDVFPEAIENYKKILSSKLPTIEIIGVNSVQEAVENSDVVITATQRLEKPIIEKEWLKPGIFGIGLEAGRAWGETISSMDKFVTDDWTQTKKFTDEGGFPQEVKTFYVELGNFVNGKMVGRSNEQENIIACNVGISAVDLAIGQVVYEKAVEERIGITLPLMENGNLIK